MWEWLIKALRFMGGAYLTVVGMAIVFIGIVDFIRWVA